MLDDALMRLPLRLAAGLALASSLTACATAPIAPPACPNGQQRLRTAQLFFGRTIGDRPGVSEADFRRFADEELTPRFPDGLTILDGGGQWRGQEDKLIRESAKVVLIVLPQGRDAMQRVDAARNAYKSRFKQEAVLVITQPACVSF